MSKQGKREPDRWPGMTAKQMRRAGRYLRSLADDLGLRDWYFTLSHAPSSDGAHASIEVTYGQKRATVFLCRGWNDEPAETQRRVLIHELLHVHLDPIEERLRPEGDGSGGGAVWAHLGNGAAQALLVDTHTDIERAVDAIASEIAVYYPLPGKKYGRSTGR